MNPCTNCPRNCLTPRVQDLGFCQASHLPEVASICVHKGEEPPIAGTRGICNVFFAHCNMRCIFCQNSDISRPSVSPQRIQFRSITQIVDRIAQVLPTTENILGFVSPSHYAHLIPEIVDQLHHRNLFPTIVYNTNAYDSVATLRLLAPYVDVYLPDFKYIDPDLALRYSATPDYPHQAQQALLEMFAQKGSSLPISDGIAFRGIIVRHLVLPGQVQNSIDCLRWLADNLSPRIHVSLMSQYCPPDGINLPDQLSRTLLPEEYHQVCQAFDQLGFFRGWVQDLSSTTNYHPDFSRPDSFEH